VGEGEVERDVPAEAFAVHTDGVVEVGADVPQGIFVADEQLVDGVPALPGHDEHVVPGPVQVIRQLGEDVRVAAGALRDQDVGIVPGLGEVDQFEGVRAGRERRPPEGAGHLGRVG
jgi:hypothetical protein